MGLVDLHWAGRRDLGQVVPRRAEATSCDWRIVSARAAVAVFDFDGTITRGDSTTAFLMATVPAGRLVPAVAARSPLLAGFALGLVSRATVKESMVTACLGGAAELEVRRRAAGWAARDLPRLVRPAAMDRMRWHQSRGHRVVLASASLELLVEPWARAAGVGDVLATRLEVRDGRLTGRLDGPNCYGAEKVVRLRAALGDLDRFELYAYGDSRGDREMLAIAQHPSYRPFR
jgi:phosphatidylglycerophosphatase C